MLTIMIMNTITMTVIITPPGSEEVPGCMTFFFTWNSLKYETTKQTKNSQELYKVVIFHKIVVKIFKLFVSSDSWRNKLQPPFALARKWQDFIATYSGFAVKRNSLLLINLLLTSSQFRHCSLSHFYNILFITFKHIFFFVMFIRFYQPQKMLEDQHSNT